MQHFSYSADPHSQIVLAPKDWTEEEWKTILKLFGLTEAKIIVFRDYIMYAFGSPNPELWKRMLPDKCDFCAYDIGPHGKGHENCKGCTGHCNFELKKRMHQRHQYEWELYCEHVEGKGE